MRIISNISVSIIALFIFSSSINNDYKSEIKAWQNELNSEFKGVKTSPLTKKDRENFTKLDFYNIDQSYELVAKFVLNKNKKEFGMRTTTERRPVYVKYGVASFKLKGKSFDINIYQNIELSKKYKYKDYLFMLFTDKTSGITSYAGGRYIDLRIPKGEEIAIDFNKCYNPYCAYNHKYSCPIPPEEDYLDLEIKAGVKAFH